MTVVHLKGEMKPPIDDAALLKRINSLEALIDRNHKRTKKALKQLRATIRGEINREQDSSQKQKIPIGHKRKRPATRRIVKEANISPGDTSSTSSSDSDGSSSDFSSSGDKQVDSSDSSSSSSSSSEEEEGKDSDDAGIIDVVATTSSSDSDSEGSRVKKGGPVAPIANRKRGRPAKSKPAGPGGATPKKKPMVIAASEEAMPKYTLNREISSVQEVWKEWRHGLSRRLPAVEQLEKEYGASWRKDDDEFYLTERQPIITEVIKRVNEHGEDEELAAERLEIYRIKNSITTLGELAKRIRVHRQMDEERGLKPPTLFTKK